jgi:hypothetical protein
VLERSSLELSIEVLVRILGSDWPIESWGAAVLAVLIRVASAEAAAGAAGV